MTHEQRRATILAATLAVMARKGIAGTTVRDVAAEMGTSSGLIHHYVGSMDELLATAFEQVADADLRATVADMDRGVGPVQRLGRFVASYSRADNDAAFQLWLDAWAEAARPTGAARGVDPAQRRLAASSSPRPSGPASLPAP